MSKRAVILFAASLVLGLLAFGGSADPSGPKDPMGADPQPYRQPGINPFVGKWVNADAGTDRFTKMSIGIWGGRMWVALWASCSPEDCFWGSVDAQIPRCETQRIEATWVTPIGNEFMEVIYQADDHLEIRGKSMYTYDASGRCESYTLHFVRGDFPDLGPM